MVGSHAFESIEPDRTALVVIDLDTATVGSNDECQRLVPRVNELAAAVRSAGGVVAWVTSHMPVMPKHFAAILGDELAAKYFTTASRMAPGLRCGTSSAVRGRSARGQVGGERVLSGQVQPEGRNSIRWE